MNYQASNTCPLVVEMAVALINDVHTPKNAKEITVRFDSAGMLCFLIKQKHVKKVMRVCDSVRMPRDLPFESRAD